MNETYMQLLAELEELKQILANIPNEDVFSWDDFQNRLDEVKKKIAEFRKTSYYEKCCKEYGDEIDTLKRMLYEFSDDVNLQNRLDQEEKQLAKFLDFKKAACKKQSEHAWELKLVRPCHRVACGRLLEIPYEITEEEWNENEHFIKGLEKEQKVCIRRCNGDIQIAKYEWVFEILDFLKNSHLEDIILGILLGCEPSKIEEFRKDREEFKKK